MFDAYCPGHGRKVLLFASDIEEIRNVHGVIEVHYRCFCGCRGVLYTGRRLDDERPAGRGVVPCTPGDASPAPDRPPL